MRFVPEGGTVSRDWRGVQAVLAAAGLVLFGLGASAQAATPTIFTVEARMITDLAPVFGTVEGERVLPARARIGGTVTALDVHDGDQVKQDQVLATIVDSTLASRETALTAQIKGGRAQVAQAQIDFDRSKRLVGQGAVSRAEYDRARSALQVAKSTLDARIAQRDTIVKQIAQGAVDAPAAGRVLHVKVSKGSVLMAGDTIAEIAEAPVRVRLEVPERYTRFLHKDALVRISGAQLGLKGTLFGRLTTIKPAVSNGRVTAYATVPDLPDFFVGARVEAWLPAAKHEAIVIPARDIISLSGSDYVKIRRPDGQVIEAPVQRGPAQPSPEMKNGVEIVSGLASGDVVVAP